MVISFLTRRCVQAHVSQVLGIKELRGVYVVHQVPAPGPPGAPQNFFMGIRSGLIDYSILKKIVAAKKKNNNNINGVITLG